MMIAALVDVGDKHRLRRLLERLDDVKIAAQLDNMDGPSTLRVLSMLPADRRALVVGAMRYEAAALVLAQLALEAAASLVDDLNTDDAVDILGRIDKDKLAQILARLDRDDAEELEALLGYDERSAGGIMSPDYFSVSPDATVAETLAAIQASDDVPAGAFHVYAIDPDDRLVGVCSLRDLVIGRPTQRIADLMDTQVVTAKLDQDQEEVADLVSRYDLVAIPVVDAQNRMVGIVEVDDVVDVIREEATEDILKMAGAGEALAEARSFVSSFRARWRWLGVAAAGGLVVATSLSGFQTSLAEKPALALFMPIVAGMGGNVGIQSSTIVVRGLAVGFVETSRVRRLILREVGLGVAMGLVYGVLIAVVASSLGFRADAAELGLVVAGGTLGSMTIASIVGTCTPLILDRFGVDPAIASGPFVTASVDGMGLLFYFWLASVLVGVGS